MSSGRSIEDKASKRGGGDEEGEKEGTGEGAGEGEEEEVRGVGEVGGDWVEGKGVGDPDEIWRSCDRRWVIINKYFVTDGK